MVDAPKRVSPPMECAEPVEERQTLDELAYLPDAYDSGLFTHKYANQPPTVRYIPAKKKPTPP